MERLAGKECVASGVETAQPPSPEAQGVSLALGEAVGPKRCLDLHLWGLFSREI